MAAVLTVLVVGFGETLSFAVVTQGLHRPPTFVEVLLSFQGVGGIVGGLTAAAIMRRAGEGLLCGIGLACFAVGIPLWAIPNLPIVIVGILLLGVSLPWVIVAIMTLIQRMTPNDLQGRAASALDLMIGVPQTISVAVGAALAAVVSYQLLLVGMGAVIGVAGIYLHASLEVYSPLGLPRMGCQRPANRYLTRGKPRAREKALCACAAVVFHDLN
jgi:MFS family permease